MTSSLFRRTMVAVTAEVDGNGDPVWGAKQNITAIPDGETNVAIENLLAGKRYWVRVWNEDQFGNKSPEVIHVVDTPADGTYPATPTGLTLTASSFGFRATWDANSELDFSEYEVSVAADDGSGLHPVTNDVAYTRVKTTTHWFAGEIGVTYWVRIRAFDTSENPSPWSDFATVTPFWLVPLLFGSTGVLDTDSPMYCFLSVPDTVTDVTQATLKLAFRPFSANARDAITSGTLTSNSGGGSTSGSSSSSTSDNFSIPVTLATIDHTHGGGSHATFDDPSASAAIIDIDPDHHHGMAHTHSTPDHSHTVPGHTHSLTYGTYEEGYPASHSVSVKTYKLVSGVWTLQHTDSGLTGDNETLDLTGVITGAGDWRLQVQSAAAQPNNGRLGLDMYGNITAVIG